jgi:tRNA pseudouridine55 synthase
VYSLRKISGEKKIGHSGTLDPNACGVLPLFIGKATRLIEYTEHATKGYRCEMMLGLVTDTQDIWGNVLKNSRALISNISEEAVESAFLNFVGPIKQIPPSYSAVKVKGKRLYQYAREGQVIEVDARSVTVNQITLLNFNKTDGRVLFDIECSKGTYVRTICHDIGNILGCGACMSFLLRTATSGFSLEQAKTLQELSSMTHAEFEQSLLPSAEAVKFLRRINVSSAEAELFIHGNIAFQKNLSPPDFNGSKDHDFFSIFFNNELLGTAEYKENEGYKPIKVFIQ